MINTICNFIARGLVFLTASVSFFFCPEDISNATDSSTAGNLTINVLSNTTGAAERPMAIVLYSSSLLPFSLAAKNSDIIVDLLFKAGNYEKGTQYYILSVEGEKNSNVNLRANNHSISAEVIQNGNANICGVTLNEDFHVNEDEESLWCSSRDPINMVKFLNENGAMALLAQ
jgi:hypothetical protein